MNERDSAELVERLRNLHVALLSDTLDSEYGGVHNNRYLMSPEIKPILPSMRVAGIARTYLGGTTAKINPPLTLEETKKSVWIRALEGFKRNDVLVYATNFCKTSSTVGELMANAIAARGGVGAITDGYARDVNRLLDLKPLFPFFATGCTAADTIGRFDIIEFGTPVWCGGVLVNPGDFVMGDLDGVIVIPQGIAREVIEKSEKRKESEDKVREAFRRGEPIAETFDKYKVA